MGNTYPGIFGTAASSHQVEMGRHDGPQHLCRAVQQHYQAQAVLLGLLQDLYIGDSLGNDIAPTASTTTTWGWEGPAFVFTSQTGVAASTLVESNVYTHTTAKSRSPSPAANTPSPPTADHLGRLDQPAARLGRSIPIKGSKFGRNPRPQRAPLRPPPWPSPLLSGREHSGSPPWVRSRPRRPSLQQPDRRSCQYVH